MAKSGESTMDEKKAAAVVSEAADEIRALEAKVKAARDRVAAVDHARALAVKRRELEDAVREAETAELVAALEEEHGPVGRELAVYMTPLGPLVCKRGPGVLWHRFTSSKMTDKDHEDLVRACRVHPEREVFDRILVEYPAILHPMANKIGRLYGLRREEDAGK